MPSRYYGVDDVFELDTFLYADQNRGKLLVSPLTGSLPFPVSRYYFIAEVPFGVSRGDHAHIEGWQILHCIKGKLNLEIHDGSSIKSFQLDSSNKPIVIPPTLWRSLSGFSSDSLVLALVSNAFSEPDYIRVFSDFLVFRKLSP